MIADRARPWNRLARLVLVLGPLGALAWVACGVWLIPDRGFMLVAGPLVLGLVTLVSAGLAGVLWGIGRLAQRRAIGKEPPR